MQRLKKAIEETVEAHPYIKTTLMLDDNGDILQKQYGGILKRDSCPPVYQIIVYETACRQGVKGQIKLI
mgnify:CR=1 FL=1